jgi:hypothetical protein
LERARSSGSLSDNNLCFFRPAHLRRDAACSDEGPDPPQLMNTTADRLLALASKTIANGDVITLTVTSLAKGNMDGELGLAEAPQYLDSLVKGMRRLVPDADVEGSNPRIIDYNGTHALVGTITARGIPPPAGRRLEYQRLIFLIATHDAYHVNIAGPASSQEAIDAMFENAAKNIRVQRNTPRTQVTAPRCSDTAVLPYALLALGVLLGLRLYRFLKPRQRPNRRRKKKRG